jgi:hypothetical protein
MLNKKMNMALVGATLFAMCSGALAQETCDVGAPANETIAETMAAWDFLIGDHTVDLRFWQDGEWGAPVAQAEWNGWWGLGGHAIMDEWFGPVRPDGTPGNKGVNVRVWDADVEVWRMTWQATAGAVAAIYESEVRDDGFMHMWQTNPAEEQETGAWFEITGEDTWTRVQQVRDAEGNWVPQFRLDATRTCGG